MLTLDNPKEFIDIVDNLPVECPFLELMDRTLFNAVFNLKGTSFRLTLKHNSEVYWQQKGRKGIEYPEWEMISFEEVLEACPEELQEKLIFHLELLSNEIQPRTTVGWSVKEIVGIGVANVRGITAMGLTAE